MLISRCRILLRLVGVSMEAGQKQWSNDQVGRGPGCFVCRRAPPMLVVHQRFIGRMC
jgi:hypothetical protein